MLDENLPTFFLKPSADKVKHHESYIFTQNGSEPEGVYALQHIDPSSNDAKNTYALAMFDSYNPDILYGEVLAKPGWTHPTLSQEEIRKNGGVPPPPQPIFPTEFAIQLYAPDQQVMVRQQTTKWSGTVTWEFSLPQTTFRTPSSSSLDKSHEDPSADTTTPHLNFVWKKEGRIGKDMTCYFTGKSTDPTGKKAKKNKDPDIAVALFSSLKEMTVLESNQSRLDLEDYKGFEVVLLLSAAVIRDLFFSNPREVYHVIEPNSRKNSGGLRGRKGSSPQEPARVTPPVLTPQPPQQPPRPILSPMPNGKGAPTALYNAPSSNNAKRSSLPPLQTGAQRPQRLDPRAQWDIDAETARLKAQVEAEAREQKRQNELRRTRQEQEAERKTRKFLEDEERRRKEEERQRRRKQAEVDKETERLRKQFGDQSNLLPPGRPNNRHSVSFAPSQGPWQTHRPAPAPQQPPRPQPAPMQHGPYLQAPAAHRPTASHSSFFSNGLPKPDAQAKMKKKSFWGLRTKSEEPSSTLKKKQSSMF